MTAEQVSAKRISLKYKRAAQLLCATALAGSAVLSAFAPRDAHAAIFTLKYEGKPFVPGTMIYHHVDETCGLSGNIKIEITFLADDNLYSKDIPSKWVIVNDDALFGPNSDYPKPIKFHAESEGVVYDLSYSSIPKCSPSEYGCPLGSMGYMDSDSKGSVYNWSVLVPRGIPADKNINNYQSPYIGTQYFYNTTVRNYDIFYADESEKYDKLGCNYNTPGTWTITRDGDTPPTNPVDPTDPTDPTTPATEQQAENEGIDCEKEISCIGNPINVATGNKYQAETDFTGGAHTGITLTRYYNSQDNTVTQFGANWRSTWDREIVKIDDTTVHVIRDNGRTYIFKQNGNGWNAGAGVTFSLSGSAASGWTVVDNDDNTETYSGAGSLQGIKARNGELTQLQYGSDGKLASVRGPYGHALTFHHDASGFVDYVTLPGGKQIKYQVDGNKNLVQLAYANGATQKYIYNEAFHTSGANLPHALTGIVDGNGARFATYSYNANNQATSTEHAGGVEKFQVGYNADGSRTVTDALGNQRGYSFDTVNDIVLPSAISGVPTNPAESMKTTYDANGFVASKTDFEGNVTLYQHNARGQELSRTEAAGTSLARAFTTQWHPKFNLPTQFTEPSSVPGVNRVTTWTYNDANGAMLSMTIASEGKSRSWTFSDHDQYGHPGKIIGPLGDVTTFSYNSGAPISTKDALGHGYSMTYDGDGRLVSLIDPNGLARRTTYTPRGQVATSSVGLETTTYTYDAAQNLVGVTQPDGAHYTYQNDAAHQLVRILDALGYHQDLTRDLNGNVTLEQVLDAAGTIVRQRSHAYDAVNRLVQNIGATGQTTTYVRDLNGNVTKSTDALGNTTTYERDALNRVTKITAPDGGVTKIAYNPDDSVASVQDPRGNQTLYSYDGLGNQISEQSPDRGTITRTFDAAGNALTSTDGRGLTTTNIYDLLNRLTRQQFGDGTTITFNYDEHATDSAGIGRLTSVVDASGATTFDHDQRGHVIRKKQTIGGVTLTTTYDYDQQTGHLTTAVLPSNAAVEYGYNDQTGKPETITVNGQALIGDIEYEPFSNQAKLWSEGDGSVNLYYLRETDQDGNITKVVFGDTSDTHGWAGQRILYTYDAANRLTRSKNNDDQDLIVGYDALSRVTDYTTYAPSWEYAQYTYDLNGNRTQAVGSKFGTRTLAIDPFSNRLQAVPGSATANVLYDAGGDLTQDGSYQYSMDARNKLARVSGGGVDVRYAYNGLGERVKKEGSSGASLFVQDSYQVMGEYTATGAPVQETVYLDGLPVGVIKPGGLYYVNPDPIGSPLAITNAAGTLVWSWEHAPFGDTLPNENPKGAGAFSYNLRFPGQYFDSETGSHYNNARTYLPDRGFYQQPDPIGLAGGINPYVYVGGNPANKVDELGLTSISIFPIVEWILKKVENNYMDKGKDSIYKYTYDQFWNDVAIPIIGDWDYSHYVRGAGDCLLNAPDIQACVKAASEGMESEKNRKYLKISKGRMCEPDNYSQSYPDTMPEYYIRKYSPSYVP